MTMHDSFAAYCGMVRRITNLMTCCKCLWQQLLAQCGEALRQG